METDAIAKIFGRDFLDLAAVNQTFSAKPETVDQTPLTPVEAALERARTRGEFPIQRTNQAPDGSPLTMHKMVQSLQGWFSEHGHGKILYNTDWYQNEAFFMEDTPRPGLALISKEPLKNSTGKNYWQQTQILADWVGQVFDGRDLPVPYQEALDEWAREKARLERILTSDWKGAAKGLVELQINQKLREKPVEVLQSNIVLLRTTGERRLRDVYTWTNAITSDGYLVGLGRSDSDGARVDAWDPYFGPPDLGVCSSVASSKDLEFWF